MSPAINQILGLVYRAVRRLGVVDVTKLMHLRPADVQDLFVSHDYEIRAIDAAELEILRSGGIVPAEIGDPDRLTDERRCLLIAFHGGSIASFVWLVRGSVDGLDNYSRSAHLGVSIDMPPGTAMVYNAWTAPEHRGKRLIAAILSEAIRRQHAGARSFLASIDWTNGSSLRAFQVLGMRPLGTVVRVGHGRWQFSLVPKDSLELGIRVAGDAPGYKLAM